MVQRFPKMQRIDQGLAVSILFIQLIQTPACEQERGNPFTIGSEADPAQLTTSAQKKRSSKNIRGLKAVCFQMSHLLPAASKGLAPKTGLDFLGKMR
jgi:hypothetical protein